MIVTQPPLGTPLNRIHPLSQGLVGCWLLNEGGGQIAVDMAINRNGTLTNGTSFITAQKGKCGLFDGTNDYISVQDSSMLQVESKAFSVSLWAYLNAQPASGKEMLFMMKDVPSHAGSGWGFGYDFRTANKQLNLFKSGITDQRVNYTLSNNTWYHIVAVQNFSGGSPSSITYYVNGISAGSFSNSSAYQSSSGKALDIGGGTNTYSGAQSMNGNLQNVMIYGRALTQTHVQQLYTNPYQMFISKKSGI